ncbi:MAG: shikimate dehydrogenase [Acidimicrobiales bacterium]|nr:MAG: shikimate dehydrogenase [Acidimicrobiales bacterium]
MVGLRRAAVVGLPIAHSLSPVLHQAAYQALGLGNWHYTAHECGEGQLKSFLGGLDSSWVGLSLTMPLKRVALSVADHVSPTAEIVGAANTLLLRTDGCSADNTDAPGMADALRENGLESTRSAVVVGAGGTAQAALVALSMLGPTPPFVAIAVREPARATAVAQTAQRLGLPLAIHRWSELPQLLDAAELVISTVPQPASEAVAALPWRNELAFFDALYHPWPTPAAAAAIAAGCTVISGRELLLHQAAHQVRLMTGQTAPLAAMREALAACFLT